MRIKVFCIIFLLLPTMVYAQENYNLRHREMERVLNSMKPKKRALPVARKDFFRQSERQKIIEETLRNIAIEISLDYFLARGDQIFEVVDSIGRKISRLHYSQKGNMFIVNAELRLHPRFSVGGSYGSSRFKHTVSTDTDWLPALLPNVYWESNSSCKPAVDNFNIKLYYRLLDLKDVSASDDIKEYLRIKTFDKFSLDIFTGYQHQKGRYRTTDLVDTVENWTRVTDGAIAGEDSFYKIRYQGPCLGLRGSALFNNWISTRLSFAYTWLDTKAYGWWNLRNYSFWEKGQNGRGLDLNLEIVLHLTKNWFLGTGYNYRYFKQGKMTECGLEEGVRYTDLDIIRNANHKLYGPAFKLGCIW